VKLHWQASVFLYILDGPIHGWGFQKKEKTSGLLWGYFLQIIFT
jgi:hypothetical protein